MITGDLDRALATEPGTAGTWRPVPSAALAEGRGASYATSIPLRIAPAEPGGPQRVARALAGRLTTVDWVESARAAGGYLVVTVTPQAISSLAVRIVTAGAGCARSEALAGRKLTAPPTAGLASALTWEQAHDKLRRHQAGRLCAAAGARVTWIDDTERLLVPGPVPDGAASPVRSAIDYAGIDAITYALSRIPPGRRVVIDPAMAAAHRPGNPAYAVRYAHAHAASTERQAADLGLVRGEAARCQPGLLAHPAERVLLQELSWLPERAAGAARRGRPAVLARYLEHLAGTYLDCQQSCPAVWPGMNGCSAQPPAGPLAGRPGGDPGEPCTVARLWLVAAVRTALRTGLDLLAVMAPDRL